MPEEIHASSTSNTFASPTPPTNPPHPVPQPQSKRLLPIIILLAILSVAGIGTSIFALIQNSAKDSEISDLKTKIDNLTEENNALHSKIDKSDQTTADQPQNSDEQASDTPTKQTLYLEPEGWDVKFAYPEGVTEVTAGTNDNYDGTLYIDSITYNGKIYNVDLFGGNEAYRHYPFFLGVVMRWNENTTHESWEKSPSAYDNTLIFKQNPIEYYYGGGNGYETGDKTDYDKAVELTSQLLHNITTK